MFPLVLKGPGNKLEIKDAIINSKNKKETTVWINTHGLPDYICLGEGIPNQEFQSGYSCEGFKHDEFAGILLKRGNLQEVTLIIDQCFSYDFAEHLIEDLN